MIRKEDQGGIPDRLSVTLHLDTPVSSLKQVSVKRESVLKSLGITTIRDLLNHFPRRYIDMSTVTDTLHAAIGQQCTICGSVYEVKKKLPKPRLSIVEISLTDSSGLIIITCFNQPWLADQITEGMNLRVSGKVEFNYGFKRMTNPYLEPIDLQDDFEGLIIPVYPSRSSLSQALLRRLIRQALHQIQGVLDPLPVTLRSRYNLYSQFQAWRAIHVPHSMDEVHEAKRRLIYEELLYVQLSLMEAEELRCREHKPFVHNVSCDKVIAFRGLLPFALTEDQEAAVSDIFALMVQPRPMNHFLLGDVGTGKTIVAAFCLIAAVASGYQAIMMGPTEVLVRQYGQSLGPFLDALEIPWAILTGSTTSSGRSEILERARSGAPGIFFGTHALLEEGVSFAQVSFVCIDEQQRFGVNQRETLLNKAPGADVLSMTATPIPRSLALTLYGNQSLSYLKPLEGSRGSRSTTVCHFSEEGIAYDVVREALDRGEQAYIICPLIGISANESADESSDSKDGVSTKDEEMVEYAAIEWGMESDSINTPLHAASQHAEILQNQVFPQAKVGLLHGKLSSSEKDQVMQEFRDHAIDILVSTTVVEVGVDVPNATVMIIEDADRFGLAQLHQLRGRVGRGEKPGKVFLISRSKAPDSLARLSMMESTEDGYALSEYDLSLRREGDIFGDRQHGASTLKLVNVIRDKNIIETAHTDAHELLGGTMCTEEERMLLERQRRLYRS